MRIVKRYEDLDLYLLAPVIAEPQLMTLADLNTWVTLDDLAEAHRIINFKAEVTKWQQR